MPTNDEIARYFSDCTEAYTRYSGGTHGWHVGVWTPGVTTPVEAILTTNRLLVDGHGFAATEAFNITLRIYRGGGLVKDAIYLRGLLQLLDHLAGGGTLEPFWMGKIAASHFGAIQELSLRGLLGTAALRPIFLDEVKARDRLQRAQRGLSPLDLISE